MSRIVKVAPSFGHTGRWPAAKLSRIAFSSSWVYAAWSVTSQPDDHLSELLSRFEPRVRFPSLFQRPHAVDRWHQVLHPQLPRDRVELLVVSHRRAENAPL